MDQSLIGPLAMLAGIGAVLSYVLSNMRVRKERNRFMAIHTKSISQLADAAVEAMAVEYGADIEDAMKVLMQYAQERNPMFVGLVQGGNALAAARAHIAKLRAAKGKSSDTQTSG